MDGGVGFIVIAIAVLPALGVGGMHLFHTEFSEQEQKSSPRIKDTAKQIISVYCVLTLLCFFGFCLSDMSYFEALNHTFSTISTSGFSSSSEAMDHFSPWAQWNGAIFMLLSSLPLLLVVQSVVRRNPWLIWRDQQVLGFLKLLAVLTTLATLWLWLGKGTLSLAEGLRLSFFNVVNLMSTTGYSLGQFNSWVPLSTSILAILPIIGGCSGSTVGGIKIFRLQICLTMLLRQFKRLVHPNAVLPQIYNHQELSDDMLCSVIALMMAFLVTIFLIATLLSISAPSIPYPLAEALSVVTNFGLKMDLGGSSGNSVTELPQVAKWILAGGMLLGRLEIVTVMVLFSTSFWRD